MVNLGRQWSLRHSKRIIYEDVATLLYDRRFIQPMTSYPYLAKFMFRQVSRAQLGVFSALCRSFGRDGLHSLA